jgi:hypothetical protein
MDLGKIKIHKSVMMLSAHSHSIIGKAATINPSTSGTNDI